MSILKFLFNGNTINCSRAQIFIQFLVLFDYFSIFHRHQIQKILKKFL